MSRFAMLLAVLISATTLTAGGCRSCSSCHDYDPPVAGCDCAYGTERCGSANGCSCSGGGCATGDCAGGQYGEGAYGGEFIEGQAAEGYAVEAE
jgi:hypothetical protein